MDKNFLGSMLFYLKFNDADTVGYLILFVDDILLVSNSQECIDGVKRFLEETVGKLKVQCGNNLSYLGMELVRERKEKILCINQRKYINDALEDKDVDNPVDTPAIGTIMEASKGELVDKTQYLSDYMKLMYLTKRSRSDILYALSVLATRMQNPVESDRKHLNRVFRYKRLGIRFSADEIALFCYANASATIFQANQSCMMLADRGGLASRSSKHIKVRYFSAKENVDNGEVTIEYLPMEEMIADILTKSIAGALFFKLRSLLMNEKPD